MNTVNLKYHDFKHYFKNSKAHYFNSSLLYCICVNFRVYRLFIIQETMNKNELINKIKSGQTKGLVNAYICENLHIVVTKNIDDGYIPTQTGCTQCDNVASSMMYQVNQNLGHSVEWFRPTEAEMQSHSLSLNPEQIKSHRDYVTKGGLVSRVSEAKKEA